MTGVFGAVLAAGSSRRMGGDTSKLVLDIGGRPMVWYAVDNLRRAGISRILVVIGHDRIAVRKAIGENVEFVHQEEQRGTGHAAAQLMPHLQDADCIVILFGDCPFLDPDSIRETLDTHRRFNADLTLASARLSDPRALGIIERAPSGSVARVSESREATTPVFLNSEVFAGLSVWRRTCLEKVLPLLTPRAKGATLVEQDLTEAVELVVAGGGSVAVYPGIRELDAQGPNEPIEFERATEYLRAKIRSRHVLNRVRIPDPTLVLIDFDAVILEGSTIHANSQIIGSTRIGTSCEIGPDTVLRDCIVGDGSVVGRGLYVRQVFPPGTRARDTLLGGHRHFRKPHFMITEEPRLCFGVLPFREPYLDIWRNAIAPVLQRHGFEPSIVRRPGVGIILDEIWEDINRAGLVVAEISTNNPNVWYEVGLAHALNKPVVMLCDRASRARRRRIPFDVQAQRILEYDPRKQDLVSSLDAWLKDFDSKSG